MDHHASPVRGMPLTPDIARFLKPVDNPSDGARRKSREFGESSGRAGAIFFQQAPASPFRGAQPETRRHRFMKHNNRRADLASQVASWTVRNGRTFFVNSIHIYLRCEILINKKLAAVTIPF